MSKRKNFRQSHWLIELSPRENVLCYIVSFTMLCYTIYTILYDTILCYIVSYHVIYILYIMYQVFTCFKCV